MKLVVGTVLSNLYVPFRVDVFPAKSFAHTYNILSHSVLSVITVPFVYVVPALVQSPALIQLYLAVHVFVSVCVNVILISAFFHIVELLLALIVGTIVSYTLPVLFDTTFKFVARSFATHALIIALAVHCPLGVNVKLYAVHAHVKLLSVPFVILTSHHVKLYIVLLHDTFIVNAQLTYVGAVELNVGIGFAISIFIGFADASVA